MRKISYVIFFLLVGLVAVIIGISQLTTLENFRVSAITRHNASQESMLKQRDKWFIVTYKGKFEVARRPATEKEIKRYIAEKKRMENVSFRIVQLLPIALGAILLVAGGVSFLKVRRR